MKMAIAGLLALVLAVLSFDAFTASKLLMQPGAILAPLSSLHAWLVARLGTTGSGMLLAAGALGMVLLARRPARHRPRVI